jgi:alpha-tubulin suppressor-like RCC1 family protein
LTGVKSVATADGYSYCAVLRTGGVVCWGGASVGQLGNGEMSVTASFPVRVHGVGHAKKLSGVAAIVAGYGTYCALLRTGRVDCWGSGLEGALGDHSTAARATPVAVRGAGGSSALTSVSRLLAVPAQILYPSSSFCALLSTGRVDCWGANTDGQLGAGTTNDSTVPVRVRGVGGPGRLAGVTRLSAGYQSVCARLRSGGVDCWGENGGGGNLGNGTTGPDSCGGTPCATTPTAVVADESLTPLTGARLVVNGGTDSSNCALMMSGQVRCWGQGGGGQLGDGTGSGSDVPMPVAGVDGVGTLAGATRLASTGDGYCAVLSSEHVDCWGVDEVGQTGNGLGGAPQTCFFPGTEPCWQSPVAVLGLGAHGLLSHVASVSSDNDGYCAVLTTHRVDCWGYNEVGQLGVGTATGPDSCYGYVCAASPAAVRSVLRAPR